MDGDEDEDENDQVSSFERTHPGHCCGGVKRKICFLSLGLITSGGRTKDVGRSRRLTGRLNFQESRMLAAEGWLWELS